MVAKATFSYALVSFESNQSVVEVIEAGIDAHSNEIGCALTKAEKEQTKDDPLQSPAECGAKKEDCTLAQVAIFPATKDPQPVKHITVEDTGKIGEKIGHIRSYAHAAKEEVSSDRDQRIQDADRAVANYE